MNETKIRGIEYLTENHAGAMQLADGNTVNYGVIRIDGKGVYYFTGKGLREMWSHNLDDKEKKHAKNLREILKEENGEESLMASGHIAFSPFSDIIQVFF